MNTRSLAMLLVLSLTVDPSYGQSAEELLSKADAVFSVPSSYSVSTMSTYRAGRLRSTFELESWSITKDGEDWSLSVYRSPERMKGTAYLVRGKEIWVRFASTGRVRKLGEVAASAAAGESDFSYSDLSFSSLLSGYRAIITRQRLTLQGQSCTEVTLTPLPGQQTEYVRLVAFVSRETTQYVQIDYYGPAGLLKSLTFQDYRSVGGRLFPFVMVMTNPGAGTKTEVRTSEMEIGTSRVRPEMFSPEYLEAMK